MQKKVSSKSSTANQLASPGTWVKIVHGFDTVGWIGTTSLIALKSCTIRCIPHLAFLRVELEHRKEIDKALKYHV